MRIVSFDVFDTVLTRLCAKPVDLFASIGEQLSRPDFAAARQAVESAARPRAAGGEVTLATIYHDLAPRLGWNEGDRDAAMALELATESRYIRPVEPMRPMVDAARQQNAQIVFLSDMYLPGEVIEGWLRRAQFFHTGDRLYVSCEHGASKGSGALFEKVRREFGVPFQDWTHYGDHPCSDLKKPLSLGIHAHAVTCTSLQPRERAVLHSGDKAGTAHSWLAGSMRCARLARAPTTERERVLHAVAAGAAGPLFYGFVTWCIEEAERRGLRRLYFLSRSGQVLERIARKVIESRAHKVECRYLYSSRLAYAGPAALGDPTRLRSMVAPSLVWHSIRQALAAIGIDEGEARALLPDTQGTDWTRNLDESERDRLAGTLLAPANMPRIQAALASRAKLARAYLAQEGVEKDAPIALVDTGWAGTIQSALERMVGAPDAPAHLTGFYVGHFEHGGKMTVGEMVGYTNRFNRLSLRREPSHLILLELLAQADHGPLAGFREVDGRVSPVLDPAGPANLAEIRFFQDGVVQFTEEALGTTLGEKPIDAGFARATVDAYKHFHAQPSADEARVFGRMPHSDQAKESSFAQLAPDFGPSEILRAIVSRRTRPPCWWLHGQAASGHRWLIHSYLAAKRLKWLAQTAITSERD